MEAQIYTLEPEININSKIVFDVSGSITLPIIGDVEDAIQGKQDSLVGSTNIDITDGVISTSTVLDGIISQNGDNILTNTNALSSVQTQVDALINFTGGGVNFRAYSLS